MEHTYKSLLLKNKSNSKLILFLYSQHDPVCWLSFQSKIILPNDKCLHREQSGYQYELQAIIEENGKRKKEKIIPVTMWKSDTLLMIDEYLEFTECPLDENQYDTKICIRQLNKTEDVNSGAGRNLYEILKLDPKEIRQIKSEKEIVEKIKDAFAKEMKYWHPDKHPDLEGNDMVQELLFAREILLDPETRARYNNEMDYNKGWLSLARWKSIFWPECNTEEQKTAYRRRMCQMALTLLMAAAGITATCLSGGLAAPAGVILTSVVGGGLIGAGMNTTIRLLKAESVLDGCAWEDLAKSAAIGFAAGAVTGGATAGITAGVAGVGAQAVVESSLSIGTHIGMGAASASVGGVAFSLASDAEKKFVDNEDVTIKQVLGHAAAGAMIGAATGGAVGAACGAVVNSLSGEVSAANIEGKVAKVVRRAGVSLAKNMTGSLTEQGTGAVLHGTAGFIEERLDEDCENKPVTDHVKNVAIDVATGVAKAGAISCAAAVGDVIDNAEEVRIKPRRNGLYPRTISIMNQDSDLKKEMQSSMEQESNTDGLIKVLSKGPWKSRMHVKYIIDGISKKVTVGGNGESVVIPAEAKCIDVTFQILRFIGTWCDVKKWDRKSKAWKKGVHILRYPHAKGLHRTITISGPLYYEGITKIINYHYDEVDDN